MARVQRITEEDDLRITEDGDIRILEEGQEPPYQPWGASQTFAAAGGVQSFPAIGPGRVFTNTGGFQTFETEE